MKLTRYLPLVILTVAGIAVCQLFQPKEAKNGSDSSSTSGSSEIAQVVSVDSGNTLTVVLENQTKPQPLKLCGVQAPASSQALKEESRRHLQRLIETAQGSVIVWKVNQANAHSSNLLAEVYVRTPTQEQPEMEMLLNAEQLAVGLATLADYPCPNQSILADRAATAKAEERGLWSALSSPTKP